MNSLEEIPEDPKQALLIWADEYLLPVAKQAAQKLNKDCDSFYFDGDKLCLDFPFSYDHQRERPIITALSDKIHGKLNDDAWNCYSYVVRFLPYQNKYVLCFEMKID